MDSNPQHDPYAENSGATVTKRVKRFVIGSARSATDPHVFHKISLVAFLAWVGLGADGISSACYGPAEAYQALHGHTHLAIFLALMTAVTVFIISASYMQIIEAFPTGGGGYLVASKLLNPTVGAISGCALVVDYVLTIITSIASGSDAIFSMLPPQWYQYKLPLATAILGFMIILNLRGVKESVLPIVPVFLLFLLTHLIVIVAAVVTHSSHLPTMAHETVTEVKNSVSLMGIWGMGLLLLHAYSLGGGTYTGIEAVSNGLPMLREPRVQTGKRTMIYMAVSLAFIAGGLFIAFLVYGLGKAPEGKTLNALLFEEFTGNMRGGKAFVLVALGSEALILLVAAQTGFLDGPRVLSNMAVDGWMPNRFALLSDRLVTQNGIILMGAGSLVLLWVSRGKVEFLIVLYSINVFLTFSLSQLGMVKHWWEVRATDRRWRHGVLINGVGLTLTATILVATVLLKFHDGGWLTLVITGALVTMAMLIKRHYNNTRKLLQRLDALLTESVPELAASTTAAPDVPLVTATPGDKTAIILVNGFGGLGLHTTFGVTRIFKHHFKNFVFLQVGLIDAGQFKGVQEIENLRQSAQAGLHRYERLMQSHNFSASSFYSLGTDVVVEVEKLAMEVVSKFPNSVVFTAQLVFPHETFFTKMLHNYTAFAIQKRLYRHGLPVFVLPVRV